METQKIYRAAMYVRLSKEDNSGRVESMSISNQKALIRTYVAEKEDIEICSEQVDDGFSGANFERPSFQKMMDDVRNREINCIIVKDLSRFARNFVETEEYLQNIFPFLGVRFIAINDNIDSLSCDSTTKNLILPIKNLLNDSYLADQSVKIRTQLQAMMKNGQYVGNFTPYGYLKEEGNRHRILVDMTVAPIIHEIFTKKIEGYTSQAIANSLNEQNIPSPEEYKKLIGIRHHQHFQKNEKSLWTVKAILRILQNPIYIGTLVQGKTTTQNHKSKKKIIKTIEECAVVHGNHQAIIDEFTFHTVQNILSRDTKTPSHQSMIYPLSGLVFCGDCENAMVRRNNGTKSYPKMIYQCSTYKDGGDCSRHKISVDDLEKVVLEHLNLHLKSVESLDAMIHNISEVVENLSFKSNELLNQKDEEYRKIQNKLVLTFEKYQDNLISEQEYEAYSQTFKKQSQSLLDSMEQIKKDLQELSEGRYKKQIWLEHFIMNTEVLFLTRAIAVTYLEKIQVFEDNRIEIEYRFRNEYEHLLVLAESLWNSSQKGVS